MAASVWLLNYDIAAADRDHYLSWFHDEHIPEKLAPPGYRWAAHYDGSDRGKDTLYCLDAHTFINTPITKLRSFIR